MKKILTQFTYNKDQQKGILILIGLLLFINIGFFTWKYFAKESLIVKKSTIWEKNQIWIDSLKQVNEEYQPKIYPFNPNFITDYKGAKLGMTTNELNKLFAYRKQNKYVNSPEEFQKITGVSDSLLVAIAPYFKFPDWVKNKSKSKIQFQVNYFQKNVEKIIKKSINFATNEDLVKISGIGEGISARILNEKEKFGGFASIEQLKYIWGLEPNIVEKLNERFFTENEKVKKWQINEMNIKELATFPYFNYTIARNIVSYRSMNGDFKSIEDLKNVKEFPLDKMEVIILYLEF
jgi:DNA uptake protein ComE-like DNA-binding protein